MNESQNIKIAIASGKGGTGKTMVSTNIFQALHELNYLITLVDCDAEEPNDMIFFESEEMKSNVVVQKTPCIVEENCTFCGKCHDYCSYNAIFILPPAKIIKVIEELCHGCGACSFACKHDAIIEKDVTIGSIRSFRLADNARIIEAKMNVGVFSPVPIIKDAIKTAGNTGVILFDSPPGTSCPFIQTVAEVDYVLLVTEPTPFGLSDLKQSVETLKSLKKNYGVIINRAGLGDNSCYDYLDKEGIPLLMEIPFNKSIASVYSNGDLLVSQNEEWKQQFILLYNSIIEEYGNCSN
jgi:MinD superfamily P-loop ATPase